ncbi:MerR family DNA-binding transcriptional regulator, partial [Escherichia coli]|nr:MerR family DNA-binding transcriptional regulator [Escherichia coli]
MEWMKIDQVAKRSGLTKRTIRFYEEIGLIPAP